MELSRSHEVVQSRHRFTRLHSDSLPQGIDPDNPIPAAIAQPDIIGILEGIQGVPGNIPPATASGRELGSISSNAAWQHKAVP